jgi:transposase
MSKEETARTFEVGVSSVKRYVRMAKEGESLVPGKVPGRERKLSQSGMKLLEEDLQARPAVSFEERAEFLCRLLGIMMSKSTICRMIKRLGYTRKRSVGVGERDELLKAAWRVMSPTLEAPRLVFVDGWERTPRSLLLTPTP